SSFIPSLLSFPTRRSSDLLKLIAFVAVGLFCAFWLFDSPGALWQAASGKEEVLATFLRTCFHRVSLLPFCFPWWRSSACHDSFIDRKSARLNSSHVKISYA